MRDRVMVLQGFVSMVLIVGLILPASVSGASGMVRGQDEPTVVHPALDNAGSANTIYVPDDYLAIQAAVDAASPGDTIILRDGTYTENVEVNKERLTIESENGADSTFVQAANPDDHVFAVTADHVNISGFAVTGHGYGGIYLSGSFEDHVQYCTISANVVTGKTYGISLMYASNNVLTANVASSNHRAIRLLVSPNNTLSNNAVSNNTEGIKIHLSPDNALTDNTMTDNSRNLDIFGVGHGEFVQSIDTSNTINGMPVQYLVDKEDMIVDSSWEVGYLGIVNCSNMTVKDLTLTNNGQGVLLAHSSDSRIENVNVVNNYHGVLVSSSSNNVLDGNFVSSNNHGVYLFASTNNTLAANAVDSNFYGLWLSASPSTLTNNNLSNNNRSLIVKGSDLPDYRSSIDTSNKINGKPIYYLVDEEGLVIDSSQDVGYLGLINCNNMLVKDLSFANNGQGLLLAYTSNSEIRSINAYDNRHGIYLWQSSGNTIRDSDLSNNAYYGIRLYRSSSNTLVNNRASGCFPGVGLYDSSSNIIYLNDFVENVTSIRSAGSTNIWHSPDQITYTYDGNTYTSYLGNYWSDYAGTDADGDGVGDTPYVIDSNGDNYPLMEPVGNYEVSAQLIVVTAGLPDGDVGDAYEAALEATGGTEPYMWAMIGGALPGDLDLSSATGAISGTPIETGTFNFTVQVTDDEGLTATRNLSITVIETGEVELSLKAGWNLVSVPVIPADPSVAAVFAGTEVVYAWNAAVGNYYMPVEVEPHRGYWVAVTSDTVITVSGLPVHSWTAEMTAGWNLIGSVFQSVNFTSPDTEPPGKVEPFSFRWDPDTGCSYETTIEPGMGHWVAATDACVLTLTAAEEPVHFPDPNLEAAIREAIGKPEGSIYPSDLYNLEYLDGDDRNIVDLTGLQHCTGLTELLLGANQIGDISALANLTNLTYLSLAYNQISDISPLAGLTHLEVLWLGANQISDISTLAGLTGLAFLSLHSNQISDVSPLASVTSLTTLGFSLNPVSDLSPLTSLTNLTVLHLHGIQISDVSPLAGLTGLEELFLGENRIADISAIANLVGLKQLLLWDNLISDISPLTGLTSLTQLYLYRNQISDISPLAGLTSLTRLSLWSNQISDISPLVDNTGLGEGDQVELTSNPLSDDSVNIYIPALQARGVTVYY